MGFIPFDPISIIAYQFFLVVVDTGAITQLASFSANFCGFLVRTGAITISIADNLYKTEYLMGETPAAISCSSRFLTFGKSSFIVGA
jgi:hypothetical protein